MPSVSKKQKALFGATYGAKKKGKKKPSYVPMSMWEQSLSKLKEWVGGSSKNLPKRVKKKSKR